MQKYSILILFLVMLLGCEQEQEPYEYHIVEITGIPAEYNGQDGVVIIGSGIIERYGNGTISKGKLVVDIYERTDNSRAVWRGSGNFPVMLLIGFGMIIMPGPSFIYTNGKTFQELQIDTDECAISANILFDEAPDVLSKLPKIEFRKPEDGGRKTKIEFNKLQMLD